MQPPEMPPAPGLPPPPGVPPEAPKRSRAKAIVLGAAIGLLIIAGVATLAIIRDGGDGGPYPDSLDGLERIRSSAADTFEESLATFESGQIHLSGAMYGESEAALLIVERIEGPKEDIAFVPLESTFDGAVIGFENSGAGEIDEDERVRETRSGFELICAELHAAAGDPSVAAEDGVVCSWKGTRIGIVLDFRAPDIASAIEATVRIATVIDPA